MWVEEVAQIKFDFLMSPVEQNVIPLSGLDSSAELLNAPATHGGAGGGRRTQAMAGDLQIRIRQLESALIHQPVKESLLAVEQVIRQIETPKPRIAIVEALDFSKILDQLVFGRPIEPIGRGERIPLQVGQNFFLSI